MRERDENAYIRFFALWFAAGMTLGVLLLLAASRTGMKEGNTVRLFQAEAFLGRKISAKACFSYLLKVRLAPAFAERYRRASALFPCPLSTDFSLSCGIVSDGSRMQSDGGDESSGRGHAEKRVFPLWRPLLFRTDSASLGHSARKLRQPVVPLENPVKTAGKGNCIFEKTCI